MSNSMENIVISKRKELFCRVFRRDCVNRMVDIPKGKQCSYCGRKFIYHRMCKVPDGMHSGIAYCVKSGQIVQTVSISDYTLDQIFKR